MSEARGQTYGSGDKLYRSLPHIHAHQRTSIAEETLKILRTKITHPVKVSQILSLTTPGLAQWVHK